jgi:xanthine dehydrogenase YagS FAD-binding subunit
VIPFEYVSAGSLQSAIESVHLDPAASFLAGGTTLIDLMKLDVMSPRKLVDVNGLAFDSIEVLNESVQVGANVRNSDLAAHLKIRESFPVLSEALLAGASAQIRNMASTAGNILQRTRCPYFRDAQTRCNKRQAGSGCDALNGVNRSHAVLGTSEACIATHPSDMCVALAMLDAVVVTQTPSGRQRRILFEDLHVLPGNTPARETVLQHGELIAQIELPFSASSQRSHYLKVRDRASYEFALASAAVGLELEGSLIRAARIGLGGVATKPWRSKEAEAALQGKTAERKTFLVAAEAAFATAQARKHNAYKIELGKRTLVRALEELLMRNEL